MASFKDHLKAEIFAETFSKIFFSGPAGRTVAIVFSLLYMILSITFTIVSCCLALIFKMLGAVVSAYRSSLFRTRRKAVRDLKRSVRRFGDRMEIRKGNGWTAYEISGIGLRSGDFRIALAHHPETGATRFFRSGTGGQIEIEQERIRGFLRENVAFAEVEDFPILYQNFRTHVL